MKLAGVLVILLGILGNKLVSSFCCLWIGFIFCNSKNCLGNFSSQMISEKNPKNMIYKKSFFIKLFGSISWKLGKQADLCVRKIESFLSILHTLLLNFCSKPLIVLWWSKAIQILRMRKFFFLCVPQTQFSQ